MLIVPALRWLREEEEEDREFKASLSYMDLVSKRYHRYRGVLASQRA